MDEGSDSRKWDEVVPDVLGLIFMKLSLFELLIVVPSVCKSWQKVVLGPYCWQDINIMGWCLDLEWNMRSKVDRMLRLLIPRSCGTLRELTVLYASNDSINIIASHAQSLRKLILVCSKIDASAIEKAAPMLSTITGLYLIHSSGLGARGLYAIGVHCKSLTSLCLRQDKNLPVTNVECLVIASTFPHLKNLGIPSSQIDTSTMVMILENCKHLRLLDICNCWTVELDEILKGFPMLKVIKGYDPRIRIRDQCKDEDYADCIDYIDTDDKIYDRAPLLFYGR